MYPPPVVLTCGNCGRQSPEGFAFCPHCGHPIAAVPRRVERKVVTVLFCDLVGFTARADEADPEDVRAILQPFHALARSAIERYGGTLDKYIGDAAMGVFGSPVAHEDDPERAVRAALEILNGVHQLGGGGAGEPLSVRIGIHTGEAAVALAGGVQEGENVAGDVVNTASRLQGAASAGSIVVGESTYLATRHAVQYRQLEPVSAKGKAKPIPVWTPLSIRRLATISDRPAETPFVGRQLELTLVEQTILRSIRQHAVQLVTVVGEPGVGKSRLVGELASSLHQLEADGEPQWRRGRCLPYGEGITFWALGEIVKDLAGILDSDSNAARDEKVEALLEGLVGDQAEQAWLRARLAPLIGGGVGPPVERGEAFTAWQRVLEASARTRPLVAVFEDLHWADPALLAFLEHLVEHATDVPLVVIGTARPELFDRHPTWGAGMRNAASISLPPLSTEETAELAANLLRTVALPDQTKSLLMERSEGNPLYAEEFARMLRDRGLVDGTDRAAPNLARLELPQSIQALIAGRLDTLIAEQKALLHDASVVGKMFWSGAVAFLADAAEGRVRDHLRDLSRKELVRPVPTSTVRDQAEYSFWHALVRDVAYGQIPRAARAEKHRKTAAWLESIAGERLADLAEILAHHASSALELAVASGQTESVDELRAALARYLRVAAVRTMALDVAKAEGQLARALELTPAGHPDRAQILANLAEAAFHAGSLDQAHQRYEEAIAELLARGDNRAAGDAMVRQSVVLEYRGDRPAGRALLAEAIQILSSLPPGPELARALATSAGSLMVGGRHAETIPEADRAIELADRVGERAAAARGHAFRGYARAILGDAGGIEEQVDALEALRSLGVSRAAAIGYNNLGACLIHIQGPEAGLKVLREGVDFSRTRGLGEMVVALESTMLPALFELGEWDEVLRLAEQVAEQARREGSGHDEVYAYTDRALVQACRLGAAAGEFCQSVLDRARPMDHPPMLVVALIAAGLARLAAGDRQGTIEVVREALDATAEDVVDRASELPVLVRLAVDGGDIALAEELLDRVDRLPLERYQLALLTARAALLESRGEHGNALDAYDEAARKWERWGHRLEWSHALFGAGRCLARLGLPGARGKLDEAREIFARLGARPALAAVESYLV